MIKWTETAVGDVYRVEIEYDLKTHDQVTDQLRKEIAGRLRVLADTIEPQPVRRGKRK